VYDCACLGVLDVAPLDVAADDEPLEGATNEAAIANGSTLSLGAESLLGFLVLRSDAGVVFFGLPPSGRLLWMSFLGGMGVFLLEVVSQPLIKLRLAVNEVISRNRYLGLARLHLLSLQR
jgi:hypothetical protein